VQFKTICGAELREQVAQPWEERVRAGAPVEKWHLATLKIRGIRD
jgi:hypothetical protein